MWNVKRENARHVQDSATIASKQVNCKHLLTVSNLDIIWFNLKTPEVFLRLTDFEQVFYETFFGRKSLFHFLVVLSDLLYFFTRVTS